jgi:hypothetical protein
MRPTDCPFDASVVFRFAIRGLTPLFSRTAPVLFRSSITPARILARTPIAPFPRQVQLLLHAGILAFLEPKTFSGATNIGMTIVRIDVAAEVKVRFAGLATRKCQARGGALEASVLPGLKG